LVIPFNWTSEGLKMLAPARWHKFGAVIYCEELDERKREHLVCLCLLSGSAFSWVGGTAIPWPPAGRAHSTIIRNMAGNALRTNARSAQDKADFFRVASRRHGHDKDSWSRKCSAGCSSVHTAATTIELKAYYAGNSKSRKNVLVALCRNTMTRWNHDAVMGVINTNQKSPTYRRQDAAFRCMGSL
jgi:hypothetical protein